MKLKGLLVPLFSLPSRHGIGDFGKEAFQLVNILKKHHFNAWQLLPLNPVSYGHSPYQSVSSYAIEEIYISLDDLHKRGLIGRIKSFEKDKEHLNYEDIRAMKEKHSYRAYKNYVKKHGLRKINAFRKSHPKIDEYVKFVALKELNNNVSWNEWKVFNSPLKKDKENYHTFMQMILLEEYEAVRAYASKNGISIIGDLPFYVSFDSSDVYYHKERFMIENDAATCVSGVGPDAFSKEGQLWGNPIYNFEQLKNEGFKFWIERLEHMNNLYDYVRIDHFRAFDTYYVIPAGMKDGSIGEWKEAPGYECLDAIYKALPNIKLIAEDLGDLRPEVLVLRDHYNLPGMNVLHFMIDEVMASEDGKVKDNLITYLGTHDNQTSVSAFNSFSEEKIKEIREFFSKQGIVDENIVDAFIRFALRQNNAILSIVDVLHLNDDYRLNEPNTISEKNWSFRMLDFKKLRKELDRDVYAL